MRARDLFPKHNTKRSQRAHSLRIKRGPKTEHARRGVACDERMKGRDIDDVNRQLRMPLTVYHGARGPRALCDIILREGLRPRGNGAGNWPHTPSAPGRVYFSAFVPLVYATLDHLTGPGWIFKIELPDDILDSPLFGPDEDCIGSSIGRKERWWNPSLDDPSMILRMAALVSTIDPAKYASRWREFLEQTGNASLLGRLDPTFIRRYIRVDVGNIPEVLAMFQGYCKRTWPRDPETGDTSPDVKRAVRATLQAFTDSIVDGTEFTMIDELYGPDALDRNKRVEKFRRQLKNGFTGYDV
jgi:hypothetical protein